jgi:hypothetical protein
MEGRVSRRFWLPLALAAIGALLMLPAMAGADATPSVSLDSPDNQTPSAWFVQLSGAPTAYG